MEVLVSTSPRHLQTYESSMVRSRPISEVLDAWPVMDYKNNNKVRKGSLSTGDQQWENRMPALESRHYKSYL